jgi:cell division septum initiation protein DivIVA
MHERAVPMNLSRAEILRRDFARAVDGYEPAAVDAHLAWLAERIDVLQRRLVVASAVESPDELAANAAQHVQDLLQAAGQTALAITEQARREARAIAEGAEHEVAETRQALANIRAAVDSVKGQVASLADAARAQQEIAEGIRVSLETAEFRDAGITEAEEGAPEGEDFAAAAASLSRRGIPATESSLQDPALQRLPSSQEDLSLLAVNLLLNGASPEDVRARLHHDFAGADVEAAIEEAQRRI